MRFNSEFCVSLDLLKENFEKLQSLAPKNKIIFMVKGDAYGHGLINICKYSYENLNINLFGVASIGEALSIRSVLPKAKTYVFSDIQIEDFCNNYFTEGIVPVISRINDLKLFLEHKQFNNHPFCLKFNTGMNRLGFDIEKLEEVKAVLRKNNVKSIHHLLTHFSHSFFKMKENDKTCIQYEKFCKIKENLLSDFSIEETSVANSGAIEQGFGLEESHIRPGLMLYGPASVGGYKKEPRLWSGKIISSLITKIISVRKVKKGEPIGYGGHVVHKDGLILILPLGYADGILTYYSGYKFIYKGFNARVIGRVNMDLTIIYVDTIDESNFRVGDHFEFWNNTQEKMLDFCTQVKTIPYQVFTAITARVPRKYYDK